MGAGPEIGSKEGFGLAVNITLYTGEHLLVGVVSVDEETDTSSTSRCAPSRATAHVGHRTQRHPVHRDHQRPVPAAVSDAATARDANRSSFIDHDPAGPSSRPCVCPGLAATRHDITGFPWSEPASCAAIVTGHPAQENQSHGPRSSRRRMVACGIFIVWSSRRDETARPGSAQQYP